MRIEGVVFALLFFMVVMPFTSANLEIIGDSNFSIVGDVGEVVELSFRIKNTGSHTMNNISFETTNLASFESIDSLTSGETEIVEFSVTVNNRENEELKIQGTYIEDRGVSDDEYTFEIVNENNAGIPEELRNLKLYVGDRVHFVNKIPDWVDLYDVKNGVEIRKILENENYTKNCDSEETIKYVIRRRGAVDLTEIFSLNILPTSGSVHDPLTDASIFLSIEPTYTPTVLNPTFIGTDFSMKYYTESDGIFTLKNIGNETAKNVQLTGEWLDFTKKNFDIEVGQTVSIGFTVSPTGFDDTDQTNKTYKKYIRVVGNFPTISQPVNVFIQHSNIIEGEPPEDLAGDLIQNLVDQINVYCKKNPDASLCANNVYLGNSLDDDIITLNGTRYSFSQFFASQLDTQDGIDSIADTVTNDMDIMKSDLESFKAEQKIANADIQKNLVSSQEGMDLFLAIAVGFIVSLVLIIAIYLIYINKQDAGRRSSTRGQFH